MAAKYACQSKCGCEETMCLQTREKCIYIYAILMRTMLSMEVLCIIGPSSICPMNLNIYSHSTACLELDQELPASGMYIMTL